MGLQIFGRYFYDGNNGSRRSNGQWENAGDCDQIKLNLRERLRMRFIIDEIEFGGFKFKLEYDSGGDPDYPFCAWIYYNDNPLFYGNDDTQSRRYFKKSYSKRHFRNFCFKFANDETYRTKYLIENRMY